MTDNQLVPIALLALELNTSADTLARRLAGDIVIDAVSGLRCIEAQRCREYLAKVHNEARRIHQDALRVAAEKAAQPFPLRERVRRLAQRQRPADPNLDAFGAMLAFDEDNPLERSGSAMDDMLRGGATYHRIKED